jgi:hypothetical protein
MLGQEPPQPKLWKAVLGAGVVTFPILYIADVAIFAHRPGWIYLVLACAITLGLGVQMYRKGPDGLRRIPMGVPMWKIWGSGWQPPERRDASNDVSD